MKIRIISDLHLDINKNYPFTLNDKVFTIIAGDISGNPNQSIDWIKQNIKQGIIIAGNHIVYNLEEFTIEQWKERLNIEFPIDSPISFLDNQCSLSKYFKNENLLIIGTTLYTNYTYGKLNLSENMGVATSYLNDFKYGWVQDKNYNPRFLEPKDYRRYFKKSLENIKQEVSNNPDKNIIVVTHHSPSGQSISDKYLDSVINASYVSDLEKFIKQNSNIKCWICGHLHNQKIYKIGDCLVVQNPRGYVSAYEDVNWNPNTFLDTNNWEISTKPYNNNFLLDNTQKTR